jgi:hypothetical protein
VERENGYNFSRVVGWYAGLTAALECLSVAGGKHEEVRLLTPAGLIYVALLIAFVAMPVMANWPQKQSADETR